MSLTNPKNVVTEERLSEFYGQILPYMGGMPDVLANKFSKPDLYSTDEKMIGVWTDGKPLYQKVFTNRTMPSANGLIANTVVENLEKAIETKIIASGGNQIIINPSLGQNIIAYYKGTSGVWIDYSNSPSWIYGSTVEVIIQYTKTTDSTVAVGSDTDYSTTEKIVGTWIDGSPIYQITLTNLSWAVPANAWGHYSHGISNVKRIVNAEVFFGENLAKYGALGIGGGTDGKVDICGNADARTMSLAILQYIKTS